MSRRLPMVALGLAVAAVIITLIAVVVVLTREDTAPVVAKAAQPALVDQRVAATDVVKLQTSVEAVVESGQPKGLRVKDEAVAKALGLEVGDTITAVSGRPTMASEDIRDIITRISRGHVTTLYIETMRAGTPTLLRWQVDGDLRDARLGIKSSSSSSYPSLGSLGTPGGAGSLTPPGTLPSDPFATPDPPDPDPLLDTIIKVDDHHTQVPRKTVDAWLADPTKLAKGARVVPAIKNGQPDGFKLYAIRPSSPYARLGFSNGDTVHSVNGFELESADDALEVYTKLKDATDLRLEITRRGKPVSLRIEITK